MKKHVVVLGMLATLVVAGVAAAGGGFNSAKPSNYDPKKTYLVNAQWITGIGCPNNSKITLDGVNVGVYTDPACTTSGSNDTKNAGLLLAKTGPTGNYAAAQVILKSVPSSINELGYDIRKAGADQNDPRGSHCGAGAPRFDIVDSTGATYFLGCNSPAPTSVTSSNAWLRLRWNGSTMAFPQNGGSQVALSSLVVKQIAIVFDEGQDNGGPDNFGLAVLDNIDVNGALVGK
jgi:hypothetical protein